MRRMILLSVGLVCANAFAGALVNEVTRQSQRNFPEFLEMLSLPNVADQPADIRRNAAFLERAFEKRGFKTRLLDNPAGRPAVFAELAGRGAAAKAILFYIHFDGQPVAPENWSQRSPFTPAVKKRDASGEWREVERNQLNVEPLDHELRVFARSASDDKAPINYQEALQYPSLNVRGMASAAVGARAANIVPSEAVAELDIRTTPASDGRRLFELITRHIEQQGYHLVAESPSDAERARHDKLASLKLGSVQAAARTPMDAQVGRWAVVALKSQTAPRPGVEPVRIRMMGGAAPTDVLVDALQLPFVLIPTVNADNNQHAQNENLRIGNFVTGVETVLSLLTTPY